MTAYRKIFTPDAYFGSITERRIMNYEGTIKLHGTCAAVRFDGSKIFFHDKEKEIKSLNGHFGFPAFMKSSGRTESCLKFFEILIKTYSIDMQIYDIMIFGEFCGDNIQPFDVALIHLPKCFVIFDAKLVKKNNVDTINTIDTITDTEIPENYNRWLKINMKHDKKCIIANPEILLYNVYDFETYEIQIDTNFLEKSRKIIEHFTISVNNECPFAKQLGVSGRGEGIVWKLWEGDKCINVFKTKGEAHKVKKEKNIVTFSQENVKSVEEFINKYCTENRIKQMLTQNFTVNNLKVEMKNIPQITDFVFNDIIVEESKNIDPSVDMTNAHKQISICVKNYLTNNAI